MQSLEIVQSCFEELQQAVELMPGEADAMPTQDARDVVAACAERLPPIVEALGQIVATLTGQDPGDTSATDQAIADGATSTDGSAA